MQYAFGSGILYGKKVVSTGVATPVKFGAMQGVDVTFAFTTKELYGGYQFPLDIGRGTAKITGKASFAQLNALAFNDLFFNQSGITAGEVAAVVGEALTVSANLATPAHNGANVFVEDLGVINSSGIALTRVTTAPSGTGNYSCNETTGVYTFNSATNNAVVNISYTWNDSGNGSTVTLTNQVIGTYSQFAVVLTEVKNGKRLNLKLNVCTSTQLALPFKLEDYMIAGFDFSAQADSSGNVGSLYTEE